MYRTIEEYIRYFFYSDEAIWFAIQKGIEASKSTVRYFKHNDAKDLERLLSEAAEKKELSSKRRAFLIVEAIYFNTGEMCPLKHVVELARRFKLRIILDESLTIGVSYETIYHFFLCVCVMQGFLCVNKLHTCTVHLANKSPVILL